MKIFTPYRVCPLGAHVDHQHGVKRYDIGNLESYEEICRAYRIMGLNRGSVPRMKAA